MNHYGSVSQADEFFASRLNKWSGTPEQKAKALAHATMLIDRLEYNGQKPEGQPLEFPRGAGAVPVQIERATYLIAQRLLEGYGQSGSGSYGPARLASKAPQPGETHGIPSAQAFNLLAPFLREEQAFAVKRT